ncbi:MAG TPA: hypothetical protein VES65_10170 [Solirubrobacteraceae bacterium]|nr:hypothetical protein [Solirubrobacteraceae bacterium]
MPTRHNRQSRALRHGLGRSYGTRQPGSRRRLWAGWIALVLPLALVLVALLAPAGQAASRRSPEEQALAAERKAVEKEERAAVRKAEREERAAARKAARELERGAARIVSSNERNNAVVLISCGQVRWEFRNFPDRPNNTVTETLTINHSKLAPTTFSFDGPSATQTTPLNDPPGTYQIDTAAKWRPWEKGLKAGFDIHLKVSCAPTPAFSVEKLQQIAGGGGSYTTAQVAGRVGQTVDYEILVKNTGNVPLAYGGFSDPRCDPGTVSGGPGGEVAPGASTTYFCTHLLREADQSAGSYSNTVTVKGTPPHGEGFPVTHASNTVVAKVPSPEERAREEEAEKTPGEPTPPGTTAPPSTSGSSSPTSSSQSSTSSSAQSPKSGVLAFSAVTVPALKGPQGCVRGSFRASVKSAGVGSVTFYLDGHKLKTLTARNAHNGLLTVAINPAKLGVGAHRLVAKITMARIASSTKPAHASRAITVLRCRSAALTPKFTG